MIDLKIKYLIRTLPAITPEEQQRKNALYAFNCMFYARLTAPEKTKDSGHEFVARWTKNFDIFERDFILIPINYSLHWSLIVIIRPGALLVSIRKVFPCIILLYNP